MQPGEKFGMPVDRAEAERLSDKVAAAEWVEPQIQGTQFVDRRSLSVNLDLVIETVFNHSRKPRNYTLWRENLLRGRGV
jgi:hypothetical protein